MGMEHVNALDSEVGGLFDDTHQIVHNIKSPAGTTVKAWISLHIWFDVRLHEQIIDRPHGHGILVVRTRLHTSTHACMIEVKLQARLSLMIPAISHHISSVTVSNHIPPIAIS